MKPRTWDNRTKAKIVIEGLSGRPIPDICSQYQISEKQFAKWQHTFVSESHMAFQDSEAEKPTEALALRSALLFYGALLCLLVAVGASALLTAKHIWAIGLIGCGEGAGCDWILKSRWGSIVGIPTAYVGFAYFTSMLVLWFANGRQGVAKIQLTIGRIGVIISLGFALVMFVEQHLCTWCLSIHLANLMWLVILEFGSWKRKAKTAPRLVVVISALSFVLISVSALALDYRERFKSQAIAQEAAIQSLKDMNQGESVPVADAATVPTSPIEEKIVKAKVEPRRFGGRSWTGSKNPPVRVVVFQDYQCELCKQVEAILKGLLASRNDVALSVKQFPFDKDCNRLLLAENPHPGACVAARCAEAAGLAGGDIAFWKMHYWLVEREGRVTIEEASNEFTAWGFDANRFRQFAHGAEVDSIISADVEEGIKYGLKYTPMVFVNGYEARGWQSAGALPAAIELAAQLARQKPRSGDEPDSAITAHFQQWLSQPSVHMEIREGDHIRGPLSASVSIVVFGDISEQYHAKADKLIKEIIKDSVRFCYVFRAFPLQAECNDMVKRPISPHACEAAEAIEAAYIAGGAPAFWKMQQWIISKEDKFLPSLYDQGVAASGLDPTAFKTALADPRVGERIQRNIEMAKQLGVDSSPTIFINGRRVSDWQTPGLLDKIIKSLLTAKRG